MFGVFPNPVPGGPTCTTITELGPKAVIGIGLWGPNAILVVYMDPPTLDPLTLNPYTLNP